MDRSTEGWFHVVEMWECEFNRLCQLNPTLYDKLDTQRPDFFLEAWIQKKVTEKHILDVVLSGKLFCSFSATSDPETLGKGFENFSGLTPCKYFKEMSPIFAQVKCRSIFSEHVEEKGMGITPRVLLVGGLSAQEILIGTPNLRWYLQNSIVVKKIIRWSNTNRPLL